MKSIKKNKFSIIIHAPVEKVFLFLLDPANAPKWIPTVVRQETSAWPVQEGTIYRSLLPSGVWNEYVVSSLEKNKSFIMKMTDGNYHVRYMFVPISQGETELEYFEWVIRDVLPDPLPKDILLTAKTLIENG